jgi:hypothetical protein
MLDTHGLIGSHCFRNHVNIELEKLAIEHIPEVDRHII